MSLEIVDLVAAYGAAREPVLNGLTFVVPPGEVLAIVGPSGAGKTTLLRLLAGLSKPRAGRLVVDGTVWFDSERGVDLPPQHRAIGFVFQDHALFPNMSVRENVA